MPQTIPAALRAAAERFGEHAAYVQDDRIVSYADLLTQVRGVAQDFLGRDLEVGQRVVIWAPNSIEWAVAALAVTYAGGVLVPVNSRYTAHEVADVIRRTDAPLVLVADGFLGRSQISELTETGLPTSVAVLDLTTLQSIDAQNLDTAEVDARADTVSDDSVADILFTSGTTGRSKGAMSAHRQTLGVARAWAELGGVRSDDRYLVINPFFHSFGYKIGIIVGLLTGATLYPVATFDVDDTMALIDRAEITVLPGAPTIYQSMLNAPNRSNHRLTSLRLAVTGAAVVPVVLIEKMRTELGIDQVVTAFGMTEAVVVTMCRAGDPAELVATTCGRAIPGMETRIDSSSSGSSDRPVEGELLVRGDHVMLGYLDDEDATREAIDQDGWLHTGDIGTLDEAGNLRITDRLKDMYISGGFNVYPAEIEQALLRMDGIADVAVVGVLDERMGEIGKAIVVASTDLTGEDVIAYARKHLANFKAPRIVEFVDGLPRNLSGKVLKNALRGSQARTSGTQGD